MIMTSYLNVAFYVMIMTFYVIWLTKHDFCIIIYLFYYYYFIYTFCGGNGISYVVPLLFFFCGHTHTKYLDYRLYFFTNKNK